MKELGVLQIKESFNAQGGFSPARPIVVWRKANTKPDAKWYKKEKQKHLHKATKAAPHLEVVHSYVGTIDGWHR